MCFLCMLKYKGPFTLDDKNVFCLSSCVNSNIGNHATHFWRHKKLCWWHKMSVSLSPSANGPNIANATFVMPGTYKIINQSNLIRRLSFATVNKQTQTTN